MAGRDKGQSRSQECGIVLNGKEIRFTLRRSLRARRLRLEVRPETGLVAVVPRRCDIRRLHEFLQAKADWVLRNLAKYDNLRSTEGGEIKSGDVVLYLGKKLVVSGQWRWDGGDVQIKGDLLLVCLRSGEDGLDARLREWYRGQAGKLLRERADELSERWGLSYNRVMVRGQKTRWGSCSHKGNLSFNWRLVMAPRPVIDYVVLHELAHLKEMNHTRRFWKLLAGYCPRWRQHRKWLKDHGPELAAILPG